MVGLGVMVDVMDSVFVFLFVGIEGIWGFRGYGWMGWCCALWFLVFSGVLRCFWSFGV